MVVFHDNIVRPKLIVNNIIPLATEVPSATNLAVQSGSNCDIKFSSMPKVVECYFRQNLNDKLSFDFKFKFSLGYNLDGSTKSHRVRNFVTHPILLIL